MSNFSTHCNNTSKLFLIRHKHFILATCVWLILMFFTFFHLLYVQNLTVRNIYKTNLRYQQDSTNDGKLFKVEKYIQKLQKEIRNNEDLITFTSRSLRDRKIALYVEKIFIYRDFSLAKLLEFQNLLASFSGGRTILDQFITRRYHIISNQT